MPRLSPSSRLIWGRHCPKWIFTKAEAETQFLKTWPSFWHAETESQLSNDWCISGSKVMLERDWGRDQVLKSWKTLLACQDWVPALDWSGGNTAQNVYLPRLRLRPSFWKLEILFWHAETESQLSTDLVWHFPKWICTKKVGWGWDRVFENLR